jgi:hypothetical protein
MKRLSRKRRAWKPKEVNGRAEMRREAKTREKGKIRVRKETKEENSGKEERK